MSKILDAELTSQQSLIFQFAIRLNIAIPKGNMKTFLRLMEKGATEEFADTIANLDPIAQQFFAADFNNKQYERTKGEIRRRIWSLAKNPTLGRILWADYNPIDMYSEMDESKLILIDTDQDLMQSNCGMFGRIFIALALQAALRRFKGNHKPVYFYIDEAHEYFDTNIAKMMDMARKANIGMVLSHQRLSQFKDMTIRSAVLVNTSTKFVGRVEPSDQRVLADHMQVDRELLAAQPKLSFALNMQSVGSFTYPVPTGIIEAMPKTKDFEAVRREMIESYGPQTEEETKPEPKPEKTVAMGNNEDQDIEPSDTL